MYQDKGDYSSERSGSTTGMSRILLLHTHSIPSLDRRPLTWTVPPLKLCPRNARRLLARRRANQNFPIGVNVQLALSGLPKAQSSKKNDLSFCPPHQPSYYSLPANSALHGETVER